MDTWLSHLLFAFTALYSGRDIYLVLRPLTLPFFRTLQNAKFQQDNERSYVDDIVRTLFDTENVRLLTDLHISQTFRK